MPILKTKTFNIIDGPDPKAFHQIQPDSRKPIYMTFTQFNKKLCHPNSTKGNKPSVLHAKITSMSTLTASYQGNTYALRGYVDMPNQSGLPYYNHFEGTYRPAEHAGTFRISITI